MYIAHELRVSHRIIDDRIEKSIKRIRMRHNLHGAAMKNVLADWRLAQRGGGGLLDGVGAAGLEQQPDCVGVE